MNSRTNLNSVIQGYPIQFNVEKQLCREESGLIDWCITPTLAIFQLYRGVIFFILA